MTSCAATTTIREIVGNLTNPYWERLPGDNPQASTEVALASLEQLVEAAQVVVETVPYGGRTEYEALAAALAAVGPGEEAAQ